MFSGALQAEISRSTCVGLVAVLISERLLAQQQLLTNHMTEKMTVIRKSCKRGNINHTQTKPVSCHIRIFSLFVKSLISLTTSGPLLFFRYLFW